MRTHAQTDLNANAAEGSQVRMIEIINGSQLKAIPGLDVVAAQMIGPQIGSAIRSLAAMRAAQPAAAVSAGQGSIVIQGR